MYTENSTLSAAGMTRSTDSAPSYRPPAGDRAPRSRQDVAREFEQHLLTQFVDTMLKGVFEESIAGDAAMVSAGRDEQKQVWVSQLAEHLAERGGIGLADKLLAQWEQRFGPEAIPGTEVTTAETTSAQSAGATGSAGHDDTP